MAGLPPGAVVDKAPTGLPPGAVIDSQSTETKSSETSEYDGWKPGPVDNISDRLKLSFGVADIGLMGLTGGAAEIVGGIGGLITLALTGDNDAAVKRVNQWSDFLTFGGKTDGAEFIMSKVAPKLSGADIAIKDFSERRSGGSPAVAAAIETGIWGSIDAAFSAVPVTKGALKQRKILQARKQVMETAERLGIDIHLDTFADDVAAAAKVVGSESAGEQAEEYVKALRNAEYLARLKKNSLYAAALDEDLFVTTSAVRKLGAEIATDLDGRFDLDADNMVRVRRTLDDMHSTRLGFGSGQNLAVHFNQLEKVRKRINNRIKGADPEARAALYAVKGQIDDFLVNEFNSASIANGKIISNGGALTGDSAGFEAYMNARQANIEFGWFNDTKVIADLINKETSVDQFAQWLVGASSMSKRGAAAVVNKMKVLLGEDHPAIAAVRADFIYELTEPLLKLEPNLQQFANNYDRVLRKNKPLVDALGLRESDVAELANFAQVAKQLPPGGEFYTTREIIQTVSRLAVGHGVAKGAARVAFTTKVLNALGAVDKVSKHQILDAIVDVKFDGPLIQKNTPVAVAISAGAALSGLNDDEEQ